MTNNKQPKELTKKRKALIEAAVKLTIDKYGDVLRKLGNG